MATINDTENEAFLPSEIARLVVGYLIDQNCMTAYKEFLNTSKHLAECRGRKFFTKILGMTLVQILDQYCAIRALVMNINSAEFSECEDLVYKVSLLTKKFEESQNQCSGNVLDRCAKEFTPPKNFRRHSCDSIFSTEMSHKYYPKDSTKDQDVVVESTKLADLPGAIQKDLSLKNAPDKGKSHVFNDFFNSIDNQSKNLKNHKRQLSKSLSGLNNIRSSPDRNESDFRFVLGLVKRSDVGKYAKTPSKRKIVKQRNCASARKSNNTDVFPFESFDYTMMANVLLNCTEFHEKLAESINKINISSASKTDLIESSPLIDKQDILINDSKKSNDAPILDDDTQFDNIIKSIIAETEKQPIFNQLLNEVIAARENLSDSETEVLSRPETSTPEKSSNVCSPVSSPSNHEFKDNKSEGDNIKRRLRSWRSPKMCHAGQCCEKDELSNGNNKSSKILNRSAIIAPKKYPRRPRGGKKMEILKANYVNPNSPELDFNDKISDDSENQTSKNDEIEADSKNSITLSKDGGSIQAEPKCIVLSNQKVNILPQNEVLKTNSDNMINAIITNQQINCSIQKIAPNITIRNGFININEILDSRNGQYAQSFSQPTPSGTSLFQKENVNSAKTTEEIIDGNIRNCFKISGKPPELIITRKSAVAPNKPQLQIVNKAFTESEIMSMPTIVVVESSNFPIDNRSLFSIPDDKFIPIAPKIVPKVICENVNDVNVKIFDSKGVDVSLPNYDTVISESDCTGNNELSKNLSVVDDKKDDCSMKIESSHLNITVSTMEQCDTLQSDTSKINESSNNTMKTPDAAKQSEKTFSSAPSKRYSHVRVLDFNTPEKSIYKRKALTSPKMYKNRRKIFKFDQGGVKTQLINAGLFNTIPEESCQIDKSQNVDNSTEIVNSVELVNNDTIKNANSQEDTKKELDNKSNKNISTSATLTATGNTDKNIKKITPSTWDQDLRHFAISNDPIQIEENVPSKKRNNRQKTKNAKTPRKYSGKKKCIKAEAKLLEDALLNKSKENVIDSQTPSNSADIKINDTSTTSKPELNRLSGCEKQTDQHDKSNDAAFSVIDDLELSTNTTIDDSQNMKDQKEENKITKTEQNSKITTHKKSRISISNKSPKGKLALLNKSRSEAVKIGGSPRTCKTKMFGKVTGSPFKVKIGSKPFVGNKVKKNDPISTSLKTVTNIQDEKLYKENAEMNKISSDLKSSNESDIPDSHITPELPKEFRNNPINVKCNLNSRLETPCKPFVMDNAMTTPKFLSPHHSSVPISVVKIFPDMPTPNFSTPMVNSISKLSGTQGTPSSPRVTSYSSSSSYYMPDELDGKSLEIDFPSKSTSHTKSIMKKPSPVQRRKSKRCRMSRKSLQKKVHNIKDGACTNSSDTSSSEESHTESKIKNAKEEIDIQSKISEIDKNSNLDKKSTDSAEVQNEQQSKRTASKNFSNDKLRELEEKRQRMISKLKSKSPAVTKKTFKKNLPRDNNTKSLPNKEKLKKISQVSFTTSEEKKENKISGIPDKPDDKINKRKSFTPRKMLKTSMVDATSDGESYDKNLLNLLHLSLKPEQSETKPPQDTKEELNDIDNKISESKVDNKPAVNVSENIEKTNNKNLASEMNKKDKPDVIEISEEKLHDAILSNKTTDVTENENGENSKIISVEKTPETETAASVNTISITESKEQSSNNPVENETMINIVQNACLNIKWSKYEGTVIHMTPDPKKRKKNLKKSQQDSVDLANLCVDADIFDTIGNEMKTVSLKTSSLYSVFEMAPDAKLKKKLMKKESENKARPLQLLIDEMSNSTTESLSPVKTPIQDLHAETVTAVQSILPPNRSPLNIDSLTSTPIKTNNTDPETKKDSDLDHNKSEDLIGNDAAMEVATVESSEKRKRSDDDEDAESKKPKCEKSVIDIKNIDIEQVLCELHGY